MNTTKISCQVCKDLIPLVQDQVASPDSEALVKEHIQSCKKCRSLLLPEMPEDEPPASSPDDGRVLWRVKKRLFLSGLFLLIFGIGLGIFFSTSAGMFYNFAIMPASGALGYWLLRRRWWTVPGGIFLLTFLFLFLSSLFQGHTEFFASVLYASLYTLLSLTGTAIAALLHYAFGKEEPL